MNLNRRVIDTLIYIVFFLFVVRRASKQAKRKNGWSTFFRVQLQAAIDVRRFLMSDLVIYEITIVVHFRIKIKGKRPRMMYFRL